MTGSFAKSDAGVGIIPHGVDCSPVLESRTVLDAIDAVVAVIDARGRLVDGNRALEELTGIPIPELVGRGAWSVLAAREVGAGGTRLARGGSWNREIEVTDGRGERRWLAWSTVPIRDARGRIECLVATALDVTERKRLEAELANERQPSPGRAHPSAEVLAVAAHDLRGPLTVVEWQARALREQAHQTGDTHVATAMQRVLNAANQMSSLIADVLDVSLVGIRAMESVDHDFVDIVDEVLDMFAPWASTRGVRVSRSSGVRVTVACDRGKINRVLFNLLSNAVKVTPRGGDVRVEVSARDAEAVCSLKDSGPGIPRDYASRIFDRHFTRGGGGGLGLGLFIARELLYAHGGRIWVDDAEGGGAKVCFALPSRLV